MPARITQATTTTVALRGLQANLGRTQALQEQLSSGKRIFQPSDDPAATAASMQLRSARMADEQYQRNSDLARGRLSVTDTALQQLTTRVSSVRELMVASNSGALGTAGRSALAAQVDAIRAEVVGIYNTTYLDRPVFGGTIQGKQAVNPTTGAYLGNNAPVETRISHDSLLRVDIKGTDAAADVLPGLLATIATDIAAGGATATDFTDIDNAFTTLQKALGDVGARAQRVETTSDLVESHRLDLVSRISENEDVDLPETIMNLQAQQVGYQAALGAAAKVLQQSLLDFLR
ncbi:MAG: flagellar hook-associated protein FlgL [Kineosporiaceae bacterium]|nr:flagellar hook-associated protein FlgL [Kineosporiaceae bacterium]